MKINLTGYQNQKTLALTNIEGLDCNEVSRIQKAVNAAFELHHIRSIFGKIQAQVDIISEQYGQDLVLSMAAGTCMAVDPSLLERKYTIVLNSDQTHFNSVMAAEAKKYGLSVEYITFG